MTITQVAALVSVVSMLISMWAAFDTARTLRKIRKLENH